jgi:hypothetical protein
MKNIETLRIVPETINPLIVLWVNGEYRCVEEPVHQEESVGGVTFGLIKEYRSVGIDSIQIPIVNREEEMKLVKLFVFYEPKVYGKDHFAYVSPKHHSIWHYYGKGWSLMNGHVLKSYAVTPSIQPISIQLNKKIHSYLQKGKISYRPCGKGFVMGMMMFEFTLDPFAETGANIWMVHGSDDEEVLKMHYALKNRLAFPSKK